MNVAFVSYPIIFQANGGLAVQFRQTISALQNQGVDAKIFDMESDRFENFDLVHVMATVHGNHTIIESAKNAGVPVVLSSVLQSSLSNGQALRARLIDRFVGKLTGWQVQTTFGQIQKALANANHVVVLSKFERAMLERVYQIYSDKISIVPNGISKHFFTARCARFKGKFDFDKKIVLCVANISLDKNQVSVIRALRGMDCEIVLIGYCNTENRPYLDQCLSEGNGRVHYLGPLAHDDPLLASAYAASDVTVLASQTEVAPLSVMESLAAGTPAVVTKHNSLGIPFEDGVLIAVDPADENEIRNSVHKLINEPPEHSRCVNLVRDFTWDRVGEDLKKIYVSLTR